MLLSDLVSRLDTLLQPGGFRDYAPNGLQVEGRGEVRRIVTGVTASQALIDAAIADGADALLVHHGYFWKGEDARVVGIKQARLKALLTHDISLIAYHLPLDAHVELGNNAGLGRALGLEADGQTGEQNLLWHGRNADGATLAGFGARIGQVLGRTPLLIGEADRPLRRLAWCTGGAQSYFQEAIALGVDAFVTGEASEYCCHLARESGVAFIAAGHHATERFGAQALAGWLHGQDGLSARYVDIDNPV